MSKPVEAREVTLMQAMDIQREEDFPSWPLKKKKKRFPVFRCPAALTRAEGSSSASVKTLESATSPSIAGKLRNAAH